MMGSMSEQSRQSSEWTYFIHYLRNTLGTLGSLSDYYMTYPPNTEQVQRLLTQVKRLSEQSHQYIVAFGELTRPVVLQPRRLFLTDWLKERVNAHKVATDKLINIDFSLPNDPLEIMADPVVLGQAVDAFLDNALDAMPKGGNFKVTATREGEKIVLTFANSGDPISPSIMPDLGKPFLTLKPGRMGLGLGWAKRAALAHGGDFEASNQAGGISFALKLPPTPPPSHA
jgi:signal transduction histidine kinase